MITLRQSALRKVLEGSTTLHEINRVTFSEEG
jgi:type II secretory ATPase GspE/PulE/Tfp pilus assembly ATPase PilB-like protein